MKPAISTEAPFRLLWRLMGERRGALLVGSALLLGASATSLIQPWLAGEVARALLGNQAQVSLASAFWWLALLVLAQAGAVIGNQWVVSGIHSELVFDLRTRLLDALQWQPLTRHWARTRGETMTLLERDADIVAGFVSGTVMGVAPALLRLLGASAMLIWIEPRYGIIAVALLPAYAVAMRLVRRRLGRLSKQVATERAESNAMADQQLAMLPVVKAFVREEAMSRRFESKEERVRGFGRALHFSAGSLGPMSELSAGLGMLILLWALSDQVVTGAMPVADFLMFFLYAFVLVGPLATLVGVYGSVHRTWGSALRVATTFAEPLESRGGKRVKAFVRSIRVEGLGFTYPGRRQLLKSLELELVKGEAVLLVGENGAGKSTLIKLLLKFHEPQAGSITIDGREYTELSAPSVRRLFSLVPQETLLLSGSIYDNIALGAADATTASVERAARLASAHEFIEQLPEGYQTRIGEGGILLSGGQRQRIALARALLYDAPILVLDEATSMLDRETERAFWQSCARALEGRTALIVGHHLQSLSFAHRVVRIDDGRAVDVLL